MLPSLTATLLNAWERGLAQSDTERAVTLLQALEAASTEHDWLTLPLGRRNAHLLNWRERLFGPQLSSLASCPHCGDTMELTLNVSDLQLPPPAPTETPLMVEQGGYRLQLRLPDSADLLQIQALSDLETARRQLFTRCCIVAEREGTALPPDHIPEALITEAEARLSDADPQAYMNLDLNCPACRHAWLAAFDIADFLWREIHAWVQRLFNDVHLLASAYGWSEAEILAMTPLRRQCYLERVRQ